MQNEYTIWADKDRHNTRARNTELGIYPTDEPVARANLRLACHFGNRQKFVDHRLMGAGRPRGTRRHRKDGRCDPRQSLQAAGQTRSLEGRCGRPPGTRDSHLEGSGFRRVHRLRGLGTGRDGAPDGPLDLPARGPLRRFDLCFARRAGARGPAHRGRKSGPLRPESGQAELQTAAGQPCWEITGSACYVPARSTPDGVASRSSRTTCRLRRRTGFSNRRRYADQRSQR